MLLNDFECNITFNNPKYEILNNFILGIEEVNLDTKVLRLKFGEVDGSENKELFVFPMLYDLERDRGSINQIDFNIEQGELNDQLLMVVTFLKPTIVRLEIPKFNYESHRLINPILELKFNSYDMRFNPEYILKLEEMKDKYGYE